ncbi:MAG: GNAT family N-acetyltransferase, partial [Candidatus Kapaibacterium sp.]
TLVNGEFAFLDYIVDHGVIALIHTFVPPIDRHQGIAFALVKFALEYATSEHLKVIDGCPSVTIFIEQHPEYETLLANHRSVD